MIFTLEALEAKEGDCLLLHWGTGDEPRLAVIDAGPGRVFEESLVPRLDEIMANRQLDRLVIDLVMVSHVDNDHVVGVKKLFAQLKKEIQQNKPANQRPYSVRRLWHNTFNDVLGDALDKYYRGLTASYQASVGGEPNPLLTEGLRKQLEARQPGMEEEEAEHVAHDISAMLAGHGEGRDLRNSHKFLRDKGETGQLNAPFEKAGKATLISASATPDPEDIDGLGVTIVGPLDDEIQALQDAFDEYIQEHGLTAEAMLAAYADESVPNLSSIVCMVERKVKNRRRRILLTGDARGDFILEGLRKARLLKKESTLKVDVLKVPHHGSDRNVTREFFETVIADTYIFSADGKHGNPDRPTFEWLIEARGPEAEYDIVMTYGVAETDAVRKAKYRGKKPWSAAKQSLAALFEEKAAAGYRFTIKAGQPARVELGDEKIPW